MSPGTRTLGLVTGDWERDTGFETHVGLAEGDKDLGEAGFNGDEENDFAGDAAGFVVAGDAGRL